MYSLVIYACPLIHFPLSLNIIYTGRPQLSGAIQHILLRSNVFADTTALILSLKYIWEFYEIPLFENAPFSVFRAWGNLNSI